MSDLPKRYPGRDRVFHRSSAITVAWHRSLAETQPPAKHKCSRPVEIHGIGLPGMFDKSTSKVPVVLHARCRKCPECLAHRRRLWTARAIDETLLSRRTWFGTLTLSPHSHWVMGCKAALRVSKRRREDFTSLTASEQFAERVIEINREITLWLKRVRKQSGAKFRYVVVTEAHESGLPHFHLLVHEIDRAVQRRVLDDQWKLGHSKFRLVNDTRECFYVCKYLSKSAEARIRASARYGRSVERTAFAEAATLVAADALRRSKEGSPPSVLGVP